MPRCAFNKTQCEDGLDGLRAWEFEYSEENGVFSREPLHNWASHPSDAFAYGCQVMADLSKSDLPDESPVFPVSSGQMNVTLDELWAETPTREDRY